MFIRNGRPRRPMYGKQVISRHISNPWRIFDALSSRYDPGMRPKFAARVKKKAEPKPHYEE